MRASSVLYPFTSLCCCDTLHITTWRTMRWWWWWWYSWEMCYRENTKLKMRQRTGVWAWLYLSDWYVRMEWVDVRNSLSKQIYFSQITPDKHFLAKIMLSFFFFYYYYLVCLIFRVSQKTLKFLVFFLASELENSFFRILNM